MLLRRVAYLLVLLLVLSGCSKNSFIGKRYENFTAYYNTFYNAKKKYREGVEALERSSNQEIDRNHYLSIFVTPDRASNQQTFNDAIKKSADVLRENPTSKWVDDALMLIGKSYFYLQNYVGAEQKFQEIIDLGGSLEDEARFWLARTLIAGNSLTRAGDHLEVSLNREELSSHWEPLLRMELGELHVKMEAWGEAAVELERSLEGGVNKDYAARAEFLLAQVYEKLEQYENAAQTYRRVLRYKPEYSLVYAAQISQVRLEGAHGEGDQALRQLRSMERDDKNFDKRAEMAYVRGRIYQGMGQPDRAFDIFDELLFSDDPTLNAGQMRGPVHYALGELYRDAYVDFSFAAAHFDTARTALSSLTRAASNGARQTQFAPEALIDSERQAETFGSFAAVYNEVAHFDSLLWLGTMEQEEFDAFILDLRRKRAEEMAAQQRELERRQAEQQFQNMSNAVQQGPRKQIDGPLASQTNSEQGFLFYKDRIRVQEGRVSFITRWGERPRVPNWRRLDAIRSATAQEGEGAGDASEESAEMLIAEASDELLPTVDYSDVPRDSARQEAMKAQRALVQYELGNVLFLSMERPDSAAAWYRMVIDEAGNQPVAQRAYYALAEVQRVLGDTDSANRLYREVLDRYPDSDFAGQVRERLGLPPVQHQVTDSLALAEAAYEKAYRFWQNKQYERAVTDMVMLASNYKAPEIVQKALLATGSIYLEWAARDHLDIYALPLPNVPDSLLLRQGLVDSTILAPQPLPRLLPAKATGQPADTTVLPADTTGLPTDTTILHADTTGLSADSTGLPADTTILHADTTGLPADTTGLLADTTGLSADAGSAALEGEKPAPILDLLNAASIRRAAAAIIRVDSLRLVSDELARKSESLAVLSDSLYSESDTLNVVSDSLRMASERLQLKSDSLNVKADSLENVAVGFLKSPETEGIGPDSLRRLIAVNHLEISAAEQEAYARSRSLKLDRLFAILKERYPQTPHAQFADQVLRAMVELRAGKGQDTTIVQALAEEDLQKKIEEMTPEERAMISSEPLDVDGEGWTLVVGSFVEADEADESMQEYRSKGYRTGVIKAATRYRVAVGHFPTLDEARSGLEVYKAELPPTTWFLDIQKPR